MVDLSKLKDPAFLAAAGQTLNQMAWAPVSPVANMGAPMAEYQKMAQAKAAENKTLQWLQQNDPEAYQYAQAGLPVNDAFQYAVQKRQEAAKPKNMQIMKGPNDSIYAIDPANPTMPKAIVEGQQKPADLPTSIDEYNWYQSQTPEKQAAYRQWKQEQQSKNGMRVTTDPKTGQTVIEQGNLGDLKEWQSKDRFWTERLVNAETKLQKYETVLTNPKDALAANVGPAGNYIKSEEYQLAEQAMKDFLAPILRKDTGAAVTQGELDLYRPLYFPVPGDSKAVIEQKRMSRQVLLQSLGNTTGVDTSPATTPDAAKQNGVIDAQDYFK